MGLIYIPLMVNDIKYFWMCLLFISQKETQTLYVCLCVYACICVYVYVCICLTVCVHVCMSVSLYV